MKRPCLEPDCSTLTEQARCTWHRSLRERQRGTATQRGYGPAHRAARRQLAATLPSPCAYGCGTWLLPDGKWVAAHVIDGDPSAGWVAACLTCNERAKYNNGPAR